jgi:hypothetical protein
MFIKKLYESGRFAKRVYRILGISLYIIMIGEYHPKSILSREYCREFIRLVPRGAHVRSTVFNPQTIQSSTRGERKCEVFREYIYIYS